ncbi:hypothetical protein M427DRAFT_31474 [Gonapodya prolifera JEL478]|uniref:Uncharacterized protein n=1 Tax=Gonapodya prolifera (strain JEL478) TaxID=1344416 RepID=A0A139AHY1_GONPJ|nr:hypothetical protein M427DRAFT_31474 [Gonapodya prolifera JEL478]|eukprot:KXS16338.1 hypothetical protein M427DRAFT_31474 [Gonapodya prolifera JEL478]
MEEETLIEDGYVTPPFPSLFIPWLGQEQSLYYREDIIYFTLIWTLIWFLLVYGIAALRSGAVLFGQRMGMFFVLGMGAYGLVSGALSGAIVGKDDTGHLPTASTTCLSSPRPCTTLSLPFI